MPVRARPLAFAVALTAAFGGRAAATPSDGVLDPCTPAAASGAENEIFKDLPPGSAGKLEAEALFAAGVTQGCQASPPLFCPSCEISRAALVTLLVRAAKLPLVSPAQPSFSDVPLTHPFFKEIETAASAGITIGCGTAVFCPEAPATRAAAAILTARAAGFAQTSPTTPSFSDVPPTHPAHVWVEALKAKCVTSGCTATEFCPDTEMLRAQAAVFVAKAFDLGDTNACLDPSDAGGSGGSAGAGSGGRWGDAGISPQDSGAGSGGASGSDPDARDDGGCGCAAAGRRAGLPLALSLALGLALLGRRRRV